MDKNTIAHSTTTMRTLNHKNTCNSWQPNSGIFALLDLVTQCVPVENKRKGINGSAVLLVLDQTAIQREDVLERIIGLNRSRLDVVNDLRCNMSAHSVCRGLAG